MNTPDPKKGSLFVPKGQVKTINAFGGHAEFQLVGEQTEGRFLMATITAGPGHGPPPHYHLNEDECFLVQEGRLSFLSAGEWKEAGPGDVVFTPRGTIHTFKNNGTTTAKMLFTALPSGFDRFFEECSVEFAKAGGPDMQRIVEISAAHGIYYV